jgi:hypothetical protein
MQVKEAHALASQAMNERKPILVGGKRAKVIAVEKNNVTVVAEKSGLLQARALSSQRLHAGEWEYRFNLERTADIFKPAKISE